MVHSESDDVLLARVRSDVRSRRAHFNHAGASLIPEPVRATVLAHLDLEAALGGYEAAAVAVGALEAVPADVAVILGCEPDEVAITESATRAWEMAVWALATTVPFVEGQRIVVDRFAYATVYGALMRVASVMALEVVVAPAAADGRVDAEALMSLVDERTALVVATHVPTHVGTVTDVAAIGRSLRDGGSDALYAVDISQSLGQMRTDVGTLGCDVAFAPGRKFLRAPRGTGILYAAAAVAERMSPLTPPFGVIDPRAPEVVDLPTGMRRFDQFEGAVAARIGLGAAARYAGEIGMARIERLVVARTREVMDLLRAIDEVKLVGTADDRGIVSFRHAKLTPDDVRAQLGDSGVNVWVNLPAGAPLDAEARPVSPSVRVSPHYLTSGADLERLDVALRALRF